MSSSSSSSAFTPGKILVVDDIVDNSFLLKIVLETEGYQVETANSGFAALEKIVAQPPDLVLLDVMMPEMNGYEVVQQIRQHPHIPPIPVILVTAYDRTTLANKPEIVADGFIHKPFNFDELLQQIKTVLGNRQWGNT